MIYNRTIHIFIFSIFFVGCSIYNSLVAQKTIADYLSDRYMVEITQEGKITEEQSVFMTESTNDKTNDCKSSWVNVPINGKTTIRVKLTDEVKEVVIKPKQKNVSYKTETNAVIIDVDKPQKLALVINGDESHPLYIFVDPLEENVPKMDTDGVVFFTPGYHSIGTHYPIKSNTVYYLAPGSYLRGDFYAYGSVENVTFRGRGVVDAGDQIWQHPKEGLLCNIQFEDGRNVHIEGITLINAGNFQFKLQTKTSDTKITFSNVNMIGWNNNTDGIHISDMDWKDHPQIGNAPRTSLLVEDCFIRANDDAILLCDGVANTTVRNSVFVDDGDGSTFCLSWGAHLPINSVCVSDCYVIQKKKNNPVFRANHAGEAHLHNIEFKNIYIDGDIDCLIGLHINAHRYDPDKGYGSITDVRFKNIYVEGTCKENHILGLDDKHTISNIFIENLVINGKKITNFHDGNFVTNEFVSDIKFK